MGYRDSYGVTEDLRFVIEKAAEYGAAAFEAPTPEAARYYRWRMRNALHIIRTPHLIRTAVRDNTCYVWVISKFMAKRMNEEIEEFVQSNNLIVSADQAMELFTEDSQIIRDATKATGLARPIQDDRKPTKPAIDSVAARNLFDAGLITQEQLDHYLGDG